MTHRAAGLICELNSHHLTSAAQQDHSHEHSCRGMSSMFSSHAHGGASGPATDAELQHTIRLEALNESSAVSMHSCYGLRPAQAHDRDVQPKPCMRQCHLQAFHQLPAKNPPHNHTSHVHRDNSSKPGAIHMYCSVARLSMGGSFTVCTCLTHRAATDTAMTRRWWNMLGPSDSIQLVHMPHTVRASSLRWQRSCHAITLNPMP